MLNFNRVIYGLSLVIFLAIAGYFIYIFNHGELADTKNFSLLQHIEYENRHKYSQPVVLLDLGGSIGEVLGLKNNSRDYPYSWVVLDHLTSEQAIVIIPPHEKLDVSCAEVNAALRGVLVENAVMDFLSRNCHR